MLAGAPMTAMYATVLLTETVFTFLVVGAIWFWGRSKAVAIKAQPSRRRRSVAALPNTMPRPYAPNRCQT